uniref:U9-Liphistoxin-Lth1a_1 n=1 Tax=Liphistius thaleban TaxID=1905330 RepID=A0A4Q8K468_9ARAC
MKSRSGGRAHPLSVLIILLFMKLSTGEESCSGVYNTCQGTKLKMMLESAMMFLNKAQNFVQGPSEKLSDADGWSSGCPDRPMDCEDLLHCGNRKSGIYTVWPRSRLISESLNVFCDMTTDGGGWTVFQRRGDFGRAKDHFYNDWDTYRKGFGDLSQDFWLGNDPLFAVTNQRLYSLRIDLKSVEGESRHAVYENFWIDSEQYDYYLHVRGYTGTAGDAFSSHNELSFSTKDVDNDKSPTSNCAASYKGGWWYGECHTANLNGLYLNGTHSSYADGVEWHPWKGYNYSFPFAEMKLRSFSFLLQRQSELKNDPR